jgi:hypothetical protein
MLKHHDSFTAITAIPYATIRGILTIAIFKLFCDIEYKKTPKNRSKLTMAKEPVSGIKLKNN